MLPLDQPAVLIALLAAGGFLMTGLLTGIWKYAEMSRSDNFQAPYYVDICHRTSLMYAFATLLIAVLAAHSGWDNRIDLWASLLPIMFFALAIGSYALHGFLRDTDNQLAKPHRLGKRQLPGGAIHGFMWALIAAELGGVTVLMAGVIKTAISA